MLSYSKWPKFRLLKLHIRKDSLKTQRKVQIDFDFDVVSLQDHPKPKPLLKNKKRNKKISFHFSFSQFYFHSLFSFQLTIVTRIGTHLNWKASARLRTVKRIVAIGAAIGWIWMFKCFMRTKNWAAVATESHAKLIEICAEKVR